MYDCSKNLKSFFSMQILVFFLQDLSVPGVKDSILEAVKVLIGMYMYKSIILKEVIFKLNLSC